MLCRVVNSCYSAWERDATFSVSLRKQVQIRKATGKCPGLCSSILDCLSDGAWSQHTCKRYKKESLKGVRHSAFKGLGKGALCNLQSFQLLLTIGSWSFTIFSFKCIRGRAKIYRILKRRTHLQILHRLGIAVMHGEDCTVLSFFS